MEHTWYVAAVWIGLALFASVIPMRTGISVGCVEVPISCGIGLKALDRVNEVWYTFVI